MRLTCNVHTLVERGHEQLMDDENLMQNVFVISNYNIHVVFDYVYHFFKLIFFCFHLL